MWLAGSLETTARTAAAAHVGVRVERVLRTPAHSTLPTPCGDVINTARYLGALALAGRTRTRRFP
jgi:hypothetical protein